MYMVCCKGTTTPVKIGYFGNEYYTYLRSNAERLIKYLDEDNKRFSQRVGVIDFMSNVKYEVVVVNDPDRNDRR